MVTGPLLRSMCTHLMRDNEWLNFVAINGSCQMTIRDWKPIQWGQRLREGREECEKVNVRRVVPEYKFKCWEENFIWMLGGERRTSVLGEVDGPRGYSSGEFSDFWVIAD